MLRQMLIAKVEAQSQEVVLIWVILKTEPDTKTRVHGSRHPGSSSKRGRKVRQEMRKVNKEYLLSKSPLDNQDPVARGLSEEPCRRRCLRNGSSENRKAGAFIHKHARCLSIVPSGVNFSTKICLGSTVPLENAPRKQRRRSHRG